MKLARVWVGLAVCLVAIMVACYPTFHPNLARAGGVIFKPPTPCTSTGQTNCQPTFNAATATPTTPPSTPGPLSLATSSAAFANPSSTPATFAIADPNFSGFYSTSVNPSGVVTAGVSGSTLTVSVVAPGNTTVSVSDGYNSVPLAVSVGTPGPLALNTPSASFASSSAPAQTFTISDPGAPVSYFSTASSPTGIVTSSVANHTLTVTPVAAGNTSVSVTDGYNTTYLSVAVLPASTPGPLAWATSSVAFANPSATPVAIGVTDPNFMGTFTASSSNNAVVTAVGGTTSVTISVVGPGSANVTVGDGYNTAVLSPVTVGTPGPLAVSASSVSFGGPVAAPTSVAVTDPGGVVTVSPTPAGIVSASISGNVIQLTPETVGTASAKVSDGYNTVSIALAVPSPTPIYTNAVPGNVATPSGSQVWPQGGAITFPTPGAFSIVAQINCMPGTVQAANGSAILGIGSGVQFKAGRCGGSTVTNPNNVGTSTQVYLSQGGANAQPTYELNSNTPYTLVATDNGSSTLSYWVCSYGTVTCSQYTGAVTGPATFTSTTGYIGVQSDGATRPFAGDIWNIQIFNTVIGNTPTNMAAAVTALQTADPYPTPFVVPAAVYTNPAPNNTATPSGSLTWPDPNGRSALTVPTPSTFTWIAQINCQPGTAQSTNGSTIMDIGNSTSGHVAMKSGICSNAAQSAGATSAQAFVSNSGTSSTPGNGLAPNTQYVIAVTNDSSNNLTYYVCTYPSSITCTAAPEGTTTSTAVFGSAGGYAGVAYDGSTRPFSGDIWNLRIYNSALVTGCSGSTSTPCPAMAAVVTAVATADPFTNGPVQFPAAGWVPYPNAGTTAGLQIPIHSVFGTDNQIKGASSPGCGVTSAGWGSIQQTAAIAGTTYNTCLHTNSASVISTLASGLGTCSAAGSQCLGQIEAWVGTGTELTAKWNSGTHAQYGNGPSIDNSVSFYVATNQTARMGVYAQGGCAGDGANGLGLTFPLASTNTNAPHYDPLWIPQLGIDSHLYIRDTITGIEWSSIESGLPASSGVSTPVSTNGNYWPSMFYPFKTNSAPGSGCSGSYSTPGTLGNYSYASSNGINITGSAGRMSFAYALRPEEVIAANGSNPAYVTHAIPFFNLCDTNSGGSSPTRYVNYPAYGYGDGIITGSNGNDCNYFSGGDSKYVDYGGLLYSDTAPNLSSSPCNILEWYMWEAAYLYGWVKNDVSTVQYNENLSFLTYNDSSDTYATTTTAQWKAASAWYNLGTNYLGDTVTENSEYTPTARNPSCGLSIANNLHYGIPPLNLSAANPTWVGTHR